MRPGVVLWMCLRSIPDDAVDRRKLGFQFLVFKQQCKASIEQFLYILTMLLKDNMNSPVYVLFSFTHIQKTGEAFSEVLIHNILRLAFTSDDVRVGIESGVVSAYDPAGENQRMEEQPRRNRCRKNK